MRRIIQSATNKCESFNGFVKWVSFGGEGIISENNREEQRKIIKYNHLISNLLIFHTVYSLTNILEQIEAEGFKISDEVRSNLSPYLTEHINRFGDTIWISPGRPRHCSLNPLQWPLRRNLN